VDTQRQRHKADTST